MRARTIEILPPLPISARALTPAIELKRDDSPAYFLIEDVWRRDEALDAEEIPEHELALWGVAR